LFFFIIEFSVIFIAVIPVQFFSLFRSSIP
jgi:hypothetical protein